MAWKLAMPQNAAVNGVSQLNSFREALQEWGLDSRISTKSKKKRYNYDLVNCQSVEFGKEK